jgi:uroporphyrinogen-III synthase
VRNRIFLIGQQLTTSCIQNPLLCGKANLFIHREFQVTTPAKLHVCSFESRKQDAMRSLIERNSAEATMAPSMRELPLDNHQAAFHFAEELFAGRIDITVFMTGVGARVLFESLEQRYEREQIVAALNATTLVIRGPKPAAVLKEWKLRIDHRAASPNTWREILNIFDHDCSPKRKVIALQEYGQSNPAFYSELKNRLATVLPVPIYRWGLPEDIRPLEEAIRKTIAGEFHILLFTSAQQLTHVLQVADSLSLKADWVKSARNCVIGSIGPTNSEALQAAGLPPDVEADPPKMGPLVKTALEFAKNKTG